MGFLRNICLVNMLFILLLFADSASAAPLLLNYQGTLTDDLNQPITGTKSMSFKVYDAPAGGNLLWSSAAMAVQVKNGLFNVAIEGFPASLFDEDSRYMAVFVETTQIGERKRLASVPYAVISENAEYAQNAKNAEHSAASDYASSAGALVSSNIPKFRVRRTARLPIASGHQILPMDIVDYDSHKAFSNGVYTVPEDGYYHISVGVGIDGGCQRVFSRVLVNGIEVFIGSDTCKGVGSSGAGDLYLQAGDRVQVGICSDVGGNACIYHSHCYMSIHQFSK